MAPGSQPADDSSTRRYATRPAHDRRPPLSLNGFLTDDSSPASDSASSTAATQAPAASQVSRPSTQAPAASQVSRPKARPFDRSQHADSDDEDLPRRTPSQAKPRCSLPASLPNTGRKVTPTSSAASVKDSVASSIGAVCSSQARTGLSTGGSSKTKEATLRTTKSATTLLKGVAGKSSPSLPKITSAFARVTSASASTAGSPMGPPPLPARPRPEASTTTRSSTPSAGAMSRAEPSAESQEDDNVIESTDAEHPIDFTDAEESQASSSSSSHKRKDTSPEGSLESSVALWELAHRIAASKKEAERNGDEWAAPSGHLPSEIYLGYGKPYIGKKNGVSCIIWPCRCCDPTVDVIRPFGEASTSNLRSHTIRVKNKRGQPTILEALAAKHAADVANSTVPLSASTTRQMAVAWVTRSCRPLGIVEDEGFLAFLSEAQRKLMPSRFTVSRDIFRTFDGMESVLKEELSCVVGCLHIALDIWTSSNGYSFLGLILCYQNSGKAVRRLLEMVPFHGSHTGLNIAKETQAVLEKYAIADRVWNIISDNASENNTMMTHLAANNALPRFKDDEEMSCRVRCGAHVMNLISKAVLSPFIGTKSATRSAKEADVDTAKNGGAEEDDEDETIDWSVEVEEGAAEDDEDPDGGEDDDEALRPIHEESDLDISVALHPDETRVIEDDCDIAKALENQTAPVELTPREKKELSARNKEIGLAIKKLAWLATTLRWAPSKRKMFRAECSRMSCETPHTIPRDVATRWSSTYEMLVRGKELWDGIIAFTERPDSPVPKDKRLKRSNRADLLKVLDLLKPLAVATKRFSAKLSPTIGDVIGVFEDIDDHFSDTQSSTTEELVWKQAALRGHLINAKYYTLTEQADVYSLAILLHPNYRQAYMDVLKWPQAWQNTAVKGLRAVYTKYYATAQDTDQATLGSQTEEFENLDKTSKALMRLAKEKQKSAAPRDAVGDWLGGLTQLQIGDKGEVVRVNPLRWWWAEYERGNDHGGLAALALDVFSCPATSVDVERLFSRAGRVVSPLRNRLLASSVARIVTVGKWFEERSVPEDLLATVLEEEKAVRKEKRAARREAAMAADEEWPNKRRKTSGDNRKDDDEVVFVDADTDMASS